MTEWNSAPRDGVDRCVCGVKYWEADGTCADCGERFPWRVGATVKLPPEVDAFEPTVLITRVTRRLSGGLTVFGIGGVATGAWYVS